MSTTVAGQRVLSSRRVTRIATIESALSYLLLTGGFLIIAVAAWLVVTTYSALPAWDGWIEIEFGAGREAQSALAWLWTQHYEHRLLIPKLFLLADLYWFHARQSFLLASIFAIQALHLLVLAWSMRVLGGWRSALWRTGIGLAAFCLFCPSQWENLTWGFQTCFVLPGFFTTSSFAALMLYWLKSQSGQGAATSWRYLLLSIVAALGATYSLSNGNLVWPLLLGAAALLRLRRPAILTILLVAIVSTALFLNDYVHPAALKSSARNLGVLIKYFLAYFGSAWVQTSHNLFDRPPSRATIHLAELIGLAGLAVFSALVFRFRRSAESSPAFSVQLTLTVLFCMGTAALTALGRFFLGPGQAFASRYQTVSLLFWCCLGLLWLARTSTGDAGGATKSLLWAQLILLCVFIFAASLAPMTLRQARTQAFQRRSAAAALLSGVYDKEQLRWADYDPDQVIALVPYMRSAGLSVFSEPQAAMLEQRLDSVLQLTSAADCVGKVESTTTIGHAWPRALHITGWAWDTKDRQPPRAIVLTTDGIISGFGAVGDWRPAQDSSGVASNFIGFAGYVGGVASSSKIDVFAVMPGGKAACHVQTLAAP